MILSNTNKSIYKRLVVFLLSVIGIFIMLYILLFRIDLPGNMPMYNKPDKFIVYKYGKTATFTQENEVYWELYTRLRSCAHSKVIDLIGHPTYASLQAPETSYLDEYKKYYIVVEAVYEQTQNMREEGSDNLYNNLYYIYCDGSNNKDNSKPAPGIYLFYQQKSEGNHFMAVENINLKKEEDYLKQLE